VPNRPHIRRPPRSNGARPRSGGALIADTTCSAVRLIYRSTAGFEETRARFDERVPLLEPSVSIELVVGGATWTEVEAAVNRTVGPNGVRRARPHRLGCAAQPERATPSTPLSTSSATRSSAARSPQSSPWQRCTHRSEWPATATPPACTSPTTSRPASSDDVGRSSGLRRAYRALGPRFGLRSASSADRTRAVTSREG